MELSRKEVYKNQKISAGVTLLSFIVMVCFFIFNTITSANPSFAQRAMPEVALGLQNGNDDHLLGEKK